MTRPMHTSHDGAELADADRSHVVRISEAFEVTPDDVLQDRSFLVGAHAMDEHDLFEHLRRRHAWDSSVAPYYVRWLKRHARVGCGLYAPPRA